MFQFMFTIAQDIEIFLKSFRKQQSLLELLENLILVYF